MSAQRMEDAIALLGRLVAFDTESSKSNLPIIDFIEDYLRARGVAFTRVPNAAGDKAAVFATICTMAASCCPATRMSCRSRARHGPAIPSPCAARAADFTAAEPAT